MIFVYDCTLPSSLENLSNWAKEAKHFTSPKCVFFIVENKADLIKDRVMSEEEGKLVSKLVEGGFASLSAKTSEGIEEFFKKVTEKVYYSWIEVKTPVVTNEMLKMYGDDDGTYTKKDLE